MGRNHTEMVKDWSEKIRTLEDDKIRLERECYRLLCFINEGNFRTCERFSGSGPQSLPYQSNVDDKHQHLFSMWANNIYKRYMSIKLTWYISNKIKTIFTPIQRISDIIIYEKIKKFIWDSWQVTRNLMRSGTDWREPKYFFVPNDHGRTFSISEFSNVDSILCRCEMQLKKIKHNKIVKPIFPVNRLRLDLFCYSEAERYIWILKNI